MITVGRLREELAKYPDDVPLRFSIDCDGWSEDGLRIFCEDRIEDCFDATWGPADRKPIEVTICMVGHFNYPDVVCYIVDEDENQ